MPALLQDWVTIQAERSPDSPAVVCGAARLTYAELDALSNQLARLLKDRGCKPGDRVAMLMPKSPMAIATLLGIYKADGIYVPLDPSSPASRLAKILDACDSRWLLASGPVGRLVQELFTEEAHSQVSLGWMAGGPQPDCSVSPAFSVYDLAGYSARSVASSNTSDSPAHILFTSGSTGTPKGVVITHGGVIRFVEWATSYFGLDGDDKISAHPPLHFDLSFFDIFGAAAVGAELHLLPSDLTLPNKLAEFIRASRLTQWFSVPSVLSYMAQFDVVADRDFPALRRVLWCGEVLPAPPLIYWMKRLPHVRFTNLYGPTETTIASSYYTVPAVIDDPRAAIPIGQACAGEELLVLDESRRPVARGEIGDLYIGGVGLALGYWRDPERTAAAFVPHPQRPSERIYHTGDLARVGEDGLVYFLGRRDTQIKSRGYRIELGEIETAVNATGAVKECAIVAVPTGGFEGSVICCAYVPAADADATPAALRRELSRLLPGYMLPGRWLTFDDLPKNANGKIDRGQLKHAFETTAA